MLVDVHQHFLTEPFLERLGERSEPPLARREDGTWTLELAGEPPYPVDPATQDPAQRSDELAQDGLDRALVALSSVLGVEGLPRDDALVLIAAHEDGVAALPEQFGGWGAVPLAEPDGADVDAVLDRGLTGITLPAGAVSDAAGLERCAPLLERLERRDAPVFVHPGPSPWGAAAGRSGEPTWWPALTRYVAQMNEAWHAFLEFGHERHPSLRVLFAMLAGCAPMHAERLAARGGPAELVRDERLFYDVSSYGPRAVGAVAGAVGRGQLVYGSDRPLARPGSMEPGVFTLAAGRNAQRLLSGGQGGIDGA